MFEPNKNEGTNESYDSGDESTSTEEEEEEIDHEFEAINSWRLQHWNGAIVVIVQLWKKVLRVSVAPKRP